MRFSYILPVALTNAVIVSAIVVMQPKAASALTGEQVNDIARSVTVMIYGINPGSGVIIAKKGSTYYVLTANHVVKTADEYKIVTGDKKAHTLDYSKVKHLPGVDLAVVQFTSDQNYQVATLANSDNAKEGATIFVSGWPNPGKEINERIRQFTTSQISARPEKPLRDGYDIVYTNVTRAGMSGGPVLDTSGRLIGIHGRGESETGQGNESGAADASKVGFNLGIPINTFLSVMPKAGVALSLTKDNSVATELTAPYVAPAKPDKRDRIKNINTVLANVNDTTSTVRNVGNTMQNVGGALRNLHF